MGLPGGERACLHEAMRSAPLLALAVLSLAGCTTDETEDAEPADPQGCIAGELEQADGTCLPAGLPMAGCVEGFEPIDGIGCAPILRTA